MKKQLLDGFTAMPIQNMDEITPLDSLLKGGIMNFSKRLKQRRETLGFTLEDLAQASGVSIERLCKLEDEHRGTLNATERFRLVEALDTTIADLMGLPITRVSPKYVGTEWY